MLSRVAERLYWAGRYLERAENTARLVSSHNRLILDIPIGSEPDWFALVEVFNAENQFAQFFKRPTEMNVHKLLLLKTSAPCSIAFSLHSAKEDIRVTRAALPDGAWEHINEMCIYMDESLGASLSRRNRTIFLKNIIQKCQLFNGLLESSLTRGLAFNFIKLGQHIERADMVTRILNVGVRDIVKQEKSFSHIKPIRWNTLLEAVSAKSAFRQSMGAMVDRDSILEFIFKSETFPRSVIFCLYVLNERASQLPRTEEFLTHVNSIIRKIKRFSAGKVEQENLERFVQKVQGGLIETHILLSRTWFDSEAM